MTYPPTRWGEPDLVGSFDAGAIYRRLKWAIAEAESREVRVPTGCRILNALQSLRQMDLANRPAALRPATISLPDVASGYTNHSPLFVQHGSSATALNDLSRDENAHHATPRDLLVDLSLAIEYRMAGIPVRIAQESHWTSDTDLIWVSCSQPMLIRGSELKDREIHLFVEVSRCDRIGIRRVIGAERDGVSVYAVSGRQAELLPGMKHSANLPNERKFSRKVHQAISKSPDVRALFFLRFGVEEIVYHGDDGIAFFHQRNVCRVR